MAESMTSERNLIAMAYQRRRNCKRSDGVQLRRHHRRGGHVPQHDPHGGRGVVPARHAAELLVRVLRQPGPRRRRWRRGQVRLRAGDARRVLQVPPPPHQLPGPRPPAPVPSDLPGRRLRRAPAGRLVLRLLPHRRGPVTLTSHPGIVRPRKSRRGERRGKNAVSYHQKGVYLYFPYCDPCYWKLCFFLSFPFLCCVGLDLSLMAYLPSHEETLHPPAPIRLLSSSSTAPPPLSIG